MRGRKDEARSLLRITWGRGRWRLLLPHQKDVVVGCVDCNEQRDGLGCEARGTVGDLHEVCEPG